MEKNCSTCRYKGDACRFNACTLAGYSDWQPKEAHDANCGGEAGKHKPPIEFAMSTRAKDKQIGGDHYKNMGVEPWDVVDTWPIEQQIGAYRHGALKYLMRMGSKDEREQEIAKGIHYLEKLLEVLRAEKEGPEDGLR